MIFLILQKDEAQRVWGHCPRPRHVSVVESGWEPPSLDSYWHFIGGSEPCRGSRTSIWKMGGRCRWPQDPNVSQRKLPGQALCGACSCLCQVAQVLRQAGACFLHLSKNPKAWYIWECCKQFIILLWLSQVKNYLTSALLRVLFLNIFCGLFGFSLYLEKVPTSQAIINPQSWDLPRRFWMETPQSGPEDRGWCCCFLPSQSTSNPCSILNFITPLKTTLIASHPCLLLAQTWPCLSVLHRETFCNSGLGPSHLDS